MLFWIYILIVLMLTIVVLIELADIKNVWRKIEYAMVLLPFLLRILQIK